MKVRICIPYLSFFFFFLINVPLLLDMPLHQYSNTQVNILKMFRVIILNNVSSNIYIHIFSPCEDRWRFKESSKFYVIWCVRIQIFVESLRGKRYRVFLCKCDGLYLSFSSTFFQLIVLWIFLFVFISHRIFPLY